jgi:hypothetical protein
MEVRATTTKNPHDSHLHQPVHRIIWLSTMREVRANHEESTRVDTLRDRHRRELNCVRTIVIDVSGQTDNLLLNEQSDGPWLKTNADEPCPSANVAT